MVLEQIYVMCNFIFLPKTKYFVITLLSFAHSRESPRKKEEERRKKFSCTKLSTFKNRIEEKHRKHRQHLVELSKSCTFLCVRIIGYTVYLCMVKKRKNTFKLDSVMSDDNDTDKSIQFTLQYLYLMCMTHTVCMRVGWCMCA